MQRRTRAVCAAHACAVPVSDSVLCAHFVVSGMAKLGEGDARWIVTDRKDGTNVNSWHWEEKDLSSVVHEELKSTFKNMQLCEGAGGLSLKIKELSEVSGDVTVAQRKGKIMCYFDLKMTLKFGGSLEGETDKADGKMTIAEVDHDTFTEDYDIAVAAADKKPASIKAEQWVRGNARNTVRVAIREYFTRLFEQHNVGKNVPGKSAASKPASGGSPAPAAAPAPTPTAAKPAVASGPRTTLEWKMDWRCPVEEFWTVLTDQGRASAYTRAPAKIEPRAGGEFNFLNGLISGYFVEVSHPSKLVMQWRLSSWPSGTFSSVIISLNREEAGVTRMEFAQAGIPDGEFDRVKGGWMGNFWEPIKMVFGFHYDTK